MKDIKLLILTNSQIILTQIEEVPTELGEPDCKLIEPFTINESTLELIPWLIDLTSQNTFMMHSDKILTITEPNSKLKDKYEKLVK
tara:strand:+ start:173 stop:430 length:258 start_codon:yes stop_codon:yes gene_type:complete